MADVKLLIDMGFDKERAEYALKATNNKGVEPAMEWLLAHADEPIPNENATNNSGDGGATVGSSSTATNSDLAAGPSSSSTSTSTSKSIADESGKSAKSLKCDDCGKLFKDHAEVEFHAAKTGHANFSESTEEKKPLTEEERKAQLVLIEEKLKQKRLEREERDRVDALEREKLRIKSGKDMTEARKRLEDLEMKKILDQRKREKAEEKEARDRVRAQIEADKAARKQREQNQQDPESPVTSTTKNITTSPTLVKTPSKDYTQTRIQVRLHDGSVLTETFNSKEQLSAVRVFIQMKTSIDTPFRLMTSFPRKIFNDDDYEKPLDALGLVPSAVLIMTK